MIVMNRANYQEMSEDVRGYGGHHRRPDTGSVICLLTGAWTLASLDIIGALE